MKNKVSSLWDKLRQNKTKLSKGSDKKKKISA